MESSAIAQQAQAHTVQDSPNYTGKRNVKPSRRTLLPHCSVGKILYLSILCLFCYTEMAGKDVLQGGKKLKE